MNNLKNSWAADYTTVSNKLVNCFGLHPMTRFLCIYLAAQSNTFQFTNATLCRALDCSEATLRKYMKQAMKFGLITRERITVNGKFGFFSYTLINPTTLQNLPDGKKTKAEKNQGGKSVRLNKEELSNKEEKSNKGRCGREGASEFQTLIDQDPPSSDELDTMLPHAPTAAPGPLQKSSAKKGYPSDGPVTTATAQRREAEIRRLQGGQISSQPAVPAPLPPPPSRPRPTLEQATETIMAELETDAGQRKLKFAASRGGVKTMPANIYAAVARYCEHHLVEKNRPLHADPITRLGGYLKSQAGKEARQAETARYYKTNSTYRKGKTVKDCPSQFDYSDDAIWTA